MLWVESERVGKMEEEDGEEKASHVIHGLYVFR
jgi:hypothetical protein